MRVVFQGEPGAYSEIAAGRLGTPEPRRSFRDVFEAVAVGDAEAGAVPLENSLGGSIHENYDWLMKYPVRIVAETYVRIEHCLLGLPGATVEDARQVLSHPQALAQCDLFFARNPHLEAVVAYDTAGSAKIVRESDRRDMLAIAGEGAAARYGLDVLARDVASDTTNITRFGFVVPEAVAPDFPVPTDRLSTSRKTTVAFTLPHKTGSLFHALCVFAFREISLTKIESRPYRRHAFEYLFYVDFQNPPDEKTSVRALDHLAEIAPILRVLGSYPCIGTSLG